MRWNSNHTFAMVAVIAIVSTTALSYIWLRVRDSNHDVQANAASMPKASLTSIQDQLKTAPEFDAQLRMTIYYQGPVPVRIAWRKPDFFFIHVDRFGDAPATWYWFENQQLCVYEEWHERGARGVCVTNIIPLADGDAERAFDLVRSKSETLAYYGHVALDLLQLIQDAAAERLDINETDTTWQFAAPPEAFDTALFEPYLFGPDCRTHVVFELLRRDRSMAEIAAIRVGCEPVPPIARVGGILFEAGFIAEFDSFRFSCDRERLKFPAPPADMMHSIEVENVDALNTEIIDNVRPVPIVK